MKTIGLLGGMSWESSLLYYKLINQYTNDILKEQNNAKSIMVTVNFNEIEKLQHENKWQEANEILIKACQQLEAANSDFIIICTNTMHKLLPQIKQKISIPFLHIAQATAIEIKNSQKNKIGLLGTKFTMQEDFYKQILLDNDIEVIIPNENDMNLIHDIIYNELCLGKIKNESKNIYIDIVNKMPNIQGVILGCTEIGLLINQDDFKDIQVFDTTVIHAKQAVDFALNK
jgi:aspartate racemase